MKKIPLTQGKFALVDDIDYEYLSQWKWYAVKHEHTFYVMRHIYKEGKRTTLYMHQVMAGILGFPNTADHINRNGLDNRRNNLRDANAKQSAENRRVSKRSKSGHTGVYWNKRRSKWNAQIGHNGKLIHLGYFDKKKDAIEARKDAESKYFTHST